MATTYNAGIVTAYGAAVRGGYTGTYEEFCRQQAGYAQSAAAVEQAKEDVQELVDGIPADYTQLSEDVNTLKEEISHIGGLSEDIKLAMLQIARKVAYVDDQGQTYYDALYDALYPPADLVSISAVYTQGGTVYDSDTLDSLKSDLVVTATYEDSSTAVVTSYTLSGTLTTGTSTITVSYGGKTATFTVTVTHDDSGDWDYIWKYEDGLPPASDWTWSTGGGSGQVHEIVSDGMKMTAKSGTNASYTMPYAPASILSAGGGIAEFEFYIPDYSAMAITTNAHIFEMMFGDGTNGLRVHLSHPKNQNNAKNIYLYDDSSAWYGGTLVQAFDYETPIVVRLEIDSVNVTGKVYVNGVLKMDNIDLTTIIGATNVKMYLGGCTVNSAGIGAVVQSVKIKYGLS